jgi:colanic acid biosynthesis glycosyl transferase WcaI
MEGSFCLMVAGILLSHLQSRPDVIVYVGAQPSIAMLARLVAQWKRLPYLVAINDLAAQAAGDVGIVKSRMLQEMLSAFEFAAYRKASGAMVLCPSFRDSLLAHRYPAERVRTIPSPVDVERIRPVPDGSVFREAHGLSARDFVVLFSGSMGLKQGMANVVEAARILQKSNPGVKWLLVGDGELRPSIEKMVKDYALAGHVCLLPLQPESEMAAMFSAADVLLLNQVSKVKNTVVPSKLLTYMAAGRPVLAAVNPASQGAVLLGESQGGVMVDPENPEALAAAVKQLQANPTALQEMGRRNREYAEKHFDRRRIFAAQEAFLAEIVKRASPVA